MIKIYIALTIGGGMFIRYPGIDYRQHAKGLHVPVREPASVRESKRFTELKGEGRKIVGLCFCRM